MSAPGYADYPESWEADRRDYEAGRGLYADRFTDNHERPPEPPQTPRLADVVLQRSALKELPDPEPLIDGVLDRGTNALLYGKWGSGKSFIALDWAASVATGRNWMGIPTTQARVLYVAAEGAFGLKARLDAWELGWKVAIPDRTLDILPTAINLTNALHVGELRALTEWEGYDVVVIDTLSRCMVGADENSAKDCGVVVDNLTKLRTSTPGGRGLVLGVHHTGKDGKTFRGSSVFEAGADTVYSVTLVDPQLGAESGGIDLLREKRKDGPQHDQHLLALDRIEYSGSAVISAMRSLSTPLDKTERSDRLLSIFVQHFLSTGASKAELRNIADMPNATFHRALSDLVESKRLLNTGTDKRPFYMQPSK